MRGLKFAAATLCLIVPLTGCIASGSSSTTISGRYIGPSTMSQIEPGRTTKDWVLATLGEPTSRATLADGRTEVWKWEHRSVAKSSGGVLLIAHGSSRAERVGAAYVEMCDGLVTRSWLDVFEPDSDDHAWSDARAD